MASDDSSTNSNVFLLPDLGEGLEDAVLIEWCVNVGQEVKDLDVLAKMETAKALMEVTSPREGVVAELHGKPGETIQVGSPLVSFQGAAADDAAEEAAALSESESPDVEEPAGAFEEDAGTVVGALGDADVDGPRKVRAAPAVRRLARDLNVDITQLAGTGVGGRVTRHDVQAAAADIPPPVAPEPQIPAARPASAKPSRTRWPSTQDTGLPPRRIPILQRPEAPTIPPGKESIHIPFRGVRRIIAQHLRHSIGHAVHFTIMDDADITALDDQRRRFTEIARQKVTLLPFIAAAVCRVISGREDPRFNRLNATVDDEKQQIIQHRTVHLGIATDTEEGLMVPVIKDADQMGVLDLGRKIQELAKKARERHIKRDEMVGSTFTISNFGSLHGRYGTPIINYPEACILAVGRAREGVVVRNHMIGVGLQLPLSLSADHRVVDGGTAAQALARIVELLQNPEELLSAAR